MKNLSLNQGCWAKILDRLEPMGPAVAQVKEKRRSTRYAYGRWVGLLEVVCHEDGGDRFWVQGRNLSREGLEFLHVGALRVNGRCTVTLKTLRDEERPTEVDVVRCRSVEEGIYEIGVQFLDPIQVHHFVTWMI